MNTIVINGKNFKNELDLHEYLKNQMDFPNYYGDNLDALWDALGETVEPTEIVIENVYEFIDNLKDCAKDFIYLFDDIQKRMNLLILK